ncbi:hypothetical protein [Xanthomarina gelatinilytica]|uniref:hypothetical protein n=1 Tax=Xanthomarina gelatinilytica TaxID=1137281 RepID=UPI003AA7D144
MTTFQDLKDLVLTLNREWKLLSEMFSKRKAIDYKYNDALELVDYDENRIQFLIEREVIRENGNLLELDDLFLEFFEQVLGVNEEINLSYIDENIRNIKENMDYFLQEPNEVRRYGYLRIIKKTFYKIGLVTIKSVVDLRRNIENTFKNEPTYKIKQLKLEHLDEKRLVIKNLIHQTFTLVNDQEMTFFNRARDHELRRIIVDLKHQLGECSHNLIDIEKQIIDYLNQIKIHGKFVEKLRKLKYLKDHFVIEAQTNIRQVLSQKDQVIFEPRISEPLKLSLDHLRTDERAFEAIQRIANNHRNRITVKMELADSIATEYLDNVVEEEVMINFEEVKNQFVATGGDLFNFIMNYDFLRAVDNHERVTIFCQIISLFEQELVIQNEFEIANDIEYAVVLPK